MLVGKAFRPVVGIIAVVVIAVAGIALVVVGLEEVVKGHMQPWSELDSEPPDAQDHDGQPLAHRRSHATPGGSQPSTTESSATS